MKRVIKILSQMNRLIHSQHLKMRVTVRRVTTTKTVFVSNQIEKPRLITHVYVCRYRRRECRAPKVTQVKTYSCN